MSNAMNTIVPPRPTAAAPAIPSEWGAAVDRPGRKPATTPAASTMSASSPRRPPPASGANRATRRKSTTAAAVRAPIFVPLTITVRKSERSVLVGATLADIAHLLLAGGGWGVGAWPAKSSARRSSGKHQQHHEIRDRPRGERPIHSPLVPRSRPRLIPRAPRHDHPQPSREREEEQHAAHPQHHGRPAEQREREQDAAEGDVQASLDPDHEREGAVAAAPVLVELIQLRERIEPREEGAEGKQHEPVPQV